MVKAAQGLRTFKIVLMESEMDSDEAKRISAQIDDATSIYRRILNEMCPQTTMFEDYLKKVKVKGFRVGSSMHKEKACEILIGYMKSLKNYRNTWRLYRLGVLKYFELQNKEFFEVLNSITKSEGISNVINELTNTVALKSIEAKVLTEFIDCFGLNKVVDLKEVEESASIPSPEFVAKKTNELIEDNKKLKEIVLKGLKEIQSIEKKVKDIAEMVERANDGGSRRPPKELPSINSANLREIKKELEGVKKELGDAIEKEGKNILSIEEKVSKKIEELNKADQELNGSIAKLILNSSEQKKVSETILKLDEKIDAVVRRVETSSISEVKGEALTYPFAKPKPSKRANILASEEKFLLYFSRELELKLLSPVDMTQAFIYHRIFYDSPVIILENYAHFRAWIEILGWKDNLLEYTASPLWISEKDWESGAKGLMVEKDIPGFVVIHNFNVALVDCYLIPFLHRFKNQQYSPLKKIILVSSELEVLGEYHDILRYGASIKAVDHKKARRFSSYLEEPKVTYDPNISSFVTFDTYNSWQLDKSRLVEKSLSEIWRACQVAVPEEQTFLASILYQAFSRRLSQEEATLASLYHTAKEWSEAMYDSESDANEIFELGLMTVDKRVDY